MARTREATDLAAGDGDEARPAPGGLALVQRFLNTAIDDATPAELRMAEAIRQEHGAGLSQPALAGRYGVSQQLVSAVLRGKRLVALPGDGANPAPASLGSAASARAWLAHTGFLTEGEAVSESDLDRLLALRRAMLDLALANNGQPPAPSGWATLERVAASVPLRVQFSGSGHVTLVALGEGVERFLGALLAAVFESVRDGTWPRFKACPADRCEHVFYDASRNGTSTWCTMAVCGNRAKVKAYQRRRTQSAGRRAFPRAGRDG